MFWVQPICLLILVGTTAKTLAEVPVWRNFCITHDNTLMLVARVDVSTLKYSDGSIRDYSQEESRLICKSKFQDISRDAAPDQTSMIIRSVKIVANDVVVCVDELHLTRTGNRDAAFWLIDESHYENIAKQINASISNFSDRPLRNGFYVDRNLNFLVQDSNDDSDLLSINKDPKFERKQVSIEIWDGERIHLLNSSKEIPNYDDKTAILKAMLDAELAESLMVESWSSRLRSTYIPETLDEGKQFVLRSQLSMLDSISLQVRINGLPNLDVYDLKIISASDASGKRTFKIVESEYERLRDHLLIALARSRFEGE